MPGHDGGMEVTVRPAAPDDGADDLLYVSARRYYDAYAGERGGRAADAAPRASAARTTRPAMPSVAWPCSGRRSSAWWPVSRSRTASGSPGASSG